MLRGFKRWWFIGVLGCPTASGAAEPFSVGEEILEKMREDQEGQRHELDDLNIHSSFPHSHWALGTPSPQGFASYTYTLLLHLPILNVQQGVNTLGMCCISLACIFLATRPFHECTPFWMQSKAATHLGPSLSSPVSFLLGHTLVVYNTLCMIILINQ